MTRNMSDIIRNFLKNLKRAPRPSPAKKRKITNLIFEKK
uniref:Uncharacterized protein n=1 Tax=viral metagenome TaxID=1070528 RepID=A0A6C0AV70_9ZZZZ